MPKSAACPHGRRFAAAVERPQAQEIPLDVRRHQVRRTGSHH